MLRRAMDDLVKWKESKDRKPLIIRGARQVGKTWLMREFGRIHYKNYAYINFDNNERMESLFSGNLDIERIITALQIETGVSIEAGNTLIVFDEVQEVPKALTSLKYFCENAPEHHIIAAGSLLGVALHPGTSFPVGKAGFMDLYPLDFMEFMLAMGQDDLLKILEDKDFALITSFKGKYIDLLKQYYYVGGMPEAVASFANSSDYGTVRDIQRRLLTAYEQDFSKHAPNETVPRIRMLWNSIPVQLARENRKFVYGLIRHGARAREYELAMTWLTECGLVYKVSRISKPGMPLKAYQDTAAFKLFMLDVGLLGAMSELDVKSLLEGNRIFEEFKGALTEQYVMQQLVASKKVTLYYWSAEKGIAEVDFAFQIDSSVIPLEVKAAENLKAKSLKSYYEKYQPGYAVRTSMSDYRQEDWLTNVPLYAIGILPDMLKEECVLGSC
ncbi:MAG: ATP-binding protein [bacterium]|nr:ATP-binding protein [bacterium]